MNEQDIQNFIKALDPYLDKKMRENLFVGMQYGKKETSNLVFPLKEIMEEKFTELNNHLVDIKGKLEQNYEKVIALESEIGMSKKDPSKIAKIEKTIADLVYWKVSIVAFFAGLTFLGTYFVWTTRVVFKQEVIEILKSEEAKQFIDTAVEQALLNNTNGIYEER